MADAPLTREEFKQGIAELRQHLDARFTAVDVRFNAIDGRFTAVEKRFNTVDQRFTSLEERLIEQMRDMQTELLRGFGPWQEGIQTRMAELELAARTGEGAIKKRMEIVERRLWEIEKKLLMNPPAA